MNAEIRLKEVIAFYLNKTNEKSLIAFIIFLSPFSLGAFPVLSYNIITVVSLIDVALFFLLYDEIINHKRILRYNFTIPALIFASSFFLSMFFGLDYQNLTEYTNFQSDFTSVIITISISIPPLLAFVFFVYISIKKIEDIYFYLQVLFFAGIFATVVSSYYLLTDFSGRLEGVFDDSNYLARLEVIIISLSVIFFTYTNKFFSKVFYSGIILFSFIILVFTYSRSSFITLSLALFLIFSKSKSKLISWLLLIVIFVGLFFIFIFVSQQRTSSADASGSFLFNSFVLDASNFTRIMLNISAFNMFLEYPIFGVGFRNFYNIYINYAYAPWGFSNIAVQVSVVHNWLFSVLGEQGLVGTLPLLYILFNIFRYFKKLRKGITELLYKKVNDSLYIIFVIIIFNGLFFPHFFFEIIFCLILGMAGGLFKLYELKITNEK